MKREAQYGKYEFVEILGSGGMAEVYHVRAKGARGFEKHFALKRIIAASWEDADQIAMFEHEAKLTSLLTHPHIVQVYDFFKTEAAYLLLMEYVPGRNLAQIRDTLARSGRTMEIPAALSIASDMCRALDYAHQRIDPGTGHLLGVVHRDISPQNALVSFEGVTKVIDFGIAMARQRPEITRVGFVRGKPAYMAPEQARGEKVTPLSDQYATCLVLLDLLLGKPISKPTEGLAERARTGEVPELEEAEARLPAELLHVLRRGLATSPGERYPNMAALERDLRHILNRSFADFDSSRIRNLMGSSFREAIQRERSGDIQRPVPEAMSARLTGELTRFSRVTPEDQQSPRLELADALRRLPIPEPPTMPLGLSRLAPKNRRLDPWKVAAILGFGLAGVALWRWPRSTPKPIQTVVLPTPPPPEKPLEPEWTETTLRIVSRPSGASLLVNGEEKTRTPARVQLPRGGTAKIELRAKGFETTTLEVVLDQPRKEIDVSLSRLVPPPPVRVTAAATPSPSLVPKENSAEYSKWLQEVDRSGRERESIAKELFDRATRSLDRGEMKSALKDFRRSRLVNESYLPAWLSEISVLERLGRLDEARLIARLLLTKRPELSTLPQLKRHGVSTPR